MITILRWFSGLYSSLVDSDILAILSFAHESTPLSSLSPFVGVGHSRGLPTTQTRCYCARTVSPPDFATSSLSESLQNT